MLNYSPLRKKRRDNIKKKIFFQLRGIKRKEMSSIFNKYLKNGDEIISVLVENIEKIKTKMILE